MLLIAAQLCRTNPDAKRLYENLLEQSNYQKVIRPVSNVSDKLTVRVGLRLTQLIDVVSKKCQFVLLQVMRVLLSNYGLKNIIFA